MADLIGDVLGPYRILEGIGAGGMATVYKAYQPGLDRYVALKVLSPAHATEPGFRERFVREAKAIANLHHPNILPVYDYGEDRGYHYLAERYVEGSRTLKDLMSLPPNLSQVANLIAQVAAALDHAHRQGIVHRDVKPSNVLMDGDWALLGDFGLAKMTESSVKLTGTGVGIGTPAYMSPEQGQGLPVDHRTDVYSLGIVLFEMLTGKIPHDSETPFAIVLRRITEPMPLPRAIDPTIPEAVERVMLKALARDPADRFASAGELATALRTALVEAGVESGVQPLAAQTQPGSPTVARQSAERTTPGPEAPPQTAVRRKNGIPWWVVVAGTLALLVVVGVVLIATGVIPTQPPESESPPEKLPPIPPEPGIVIDNSSPTFAIEAGEWGDCANGDCEGVCFGEDFRYAGPECMECRAHFEFRIAAAGGYDIWTWWPQGEDRATDTPFTILHAGDPVMVRVDQRNNGSAWYLLATLPFDAGQQGAVIVEGSTTGYVNADAIALTTAGSWRP